MLQTFEHSEHNSLINLLASCGIFGRVLEAFKKFPREAFIPKEYLYSAYSDRAIPIGYSQTNTQPSLTAMTLQSLNFTGEEKVLEIGTGSGFQTALLSFLVKKVTTVEIVQKLAVQAERKFKTLKLNNVSLHFGDGTNWNKEKSAYDAVIVNAASEKVPGNLINSLKRDGLLIMPVGSNDLQSLNIYKKTEGMLIQIGIISKVKFVPLISHRH